MQRFEPKALLLYAGSFRSARFHFDLSGQDAALPFPESGRENAIALFEHAYEECVTAGLRISALSAKKLVDSLKSDSAAPMANYIQLLEEFSHRVADEIDCEFFLQLSLTEAERYQNWRSDWETILARYPEATRDVEEMNKCFALSRYTASMFHALHVAEHGAIALGDYIGVVDPKKGWGPTEKRLRALIKDGHSKIPASLAGKFEFLEQMNREIDSMVLAWRHKVDHAANHLAILPNTDFTPDIAQHVIGAVRIFMLRLTEGLP